MSAEALRQAVERLADEWSAPESHRANAWVRERDAADRLRALLTEREDVAAGLTEQEESVVRWHLDAHRENPQGAYGSALVANINRMLARRARRGAA